jgi:hypothetical protein
MASARVSGSKGGLFDEKNEGKKSRDTAPLNSSDFQSWDR